MTRISKCLKCWPPRTVGNAPITRRSAAPRLLQRLLPAWRGDTGGGPLCLTACLISPSHAAGPIKETTKKKKSLALGPPALPSPAPSLQDASATLTQLVPELPALVRHARALLAPEREPRVGHELLRDQSQHPGPVRIPHPQHLADLRQGKRGGEKPLSPMGSLLRHMPSPALRGGLSSLEHAKNWAKSPGQIGALANPESAGSSSPWRTWS